MQRYDKFPNRPNFSATFLHKNTKKTEGMTSVKGKVEGSFYNICASAHEGEGKARRRSAGHGGREAGTEARGGGKEARGRARRRGEKTREKRGKGTG